MKKLISLFIVFSMISASVPVFAEIDTSLMEQALVSVKSKIDVPEELTEFSSSVISEEEQTFYYNWYAEDGSSNMSVSADADGHILSYDYYSSGFGDVKSISDKTADEYFTAADAFLKKVVPEMFVPGNDTLVADETSEPVITSSSCSFSWYREHGGIPVFSEGAVVNVMYDGDEFIVTNARINIDYGIEFIESYGVSIENPEERYLEEYPIELVYMKRYMPYRAAGEKDAPMLVYRFRDNDMGYILCETGEKAEQYADENIYSLDKEFGETQAAAASGGSDSNSLTPEEITELENISGLVSEDEIIAAINENPYLGDISLTADSKVSSRIYKEDERYFISVSITDKEFGVYVTADAQTGKILSYSKNFAYSGASEGREEYSDAEYESAAEKTAAFLDYQYGDELSQCTEPEETRTYGYFLSASRIVNGVEYINNGVNVYYDMESGEIASFNLTWDPDTTEFADPAGALSTEEAVQKMFEIAPLTEQFVNVDRMYTRCFGPRYQGSLNIDAVTGEDLNDRYARRAYSYSDISGHWAEKQISALAQAGIGFDGGMFEPESEITQKELLLLLTNSSLRYYSSDDDFYDYLIRNEIISEDEISPDSAVLRENAFLYMARVMGLSKIASMNEIFKSDFADASDISPDRVGAAAILTGYGIISGSAGMLRPKDNLTRAEAAVILYNYLISE